MDEHDVENTRSKVLFASEGKEFCNVPWYSWTPKTLHGAKCASHRETSAAWPHVQMGSGEARFTETRWCQGRGEGRMRSCLTGVWNSVLQDGKGSGDGRWWWSLCNVSVLNSAGSHLGWFKGCPQAPCKQGVCTPLSLWTHSPDSVWLYHFIHPPDRPPWGEPRGGMAGSYRGGELRSQPRNS